MDISKINELLQENERIKRKILDIKKKLNLKNYNKSQKDEFVKAIKVLKDLFDYNQDVCSQLSKTTARNFAELVKKVLNKNGFGHYELSFQLIEFDSKSTYASILKHYKNIDRDVFLVVSNKDTAPMKTLSLTDINNIPIARLEGINDCKIVDEYAHFMLDKKEVSIFENINFGDEWKDLYEIKTFNLGLPSEEKKGLPANFKRLINLVKEEIGISCEEKIVEKQL